MNLLSNSSAPGGTTRVANALKKRMRYFFSNAPQAKIFSSFKTQQNGTNQNGLMISCAIDQI